METINNIAGVASKAIWGEQNGQANGSEPLSGETGTGTVHEPYDKGNEEGTISHENHDVHATNNAQDSHTPQSHAQDSTANTDSVLGDTSSTGNPASGQKPTQKQQGADRPEDAPGPRDTEAIKESKETAEQSQQKNKGPKMPHTDEEREELMQKGEFPHDPNDHSGEPLKMHDGGEKKERSESVSQEGGNPHGKSLGTGEEYVKSSGLEADGGDFDVTNPGAGKEATRLLEEKGIHKSTDNKAGNEESAKPDASPSPSENAGKRSKIDRLKEKLHIKK